MTQMSPYKISASAFAAMNAKVAFNPADYPAPAISEVISDAALAGPDHSKKIKLK